MTGQLIVLYGINNIGKSTQAKLLVEKLKQSGKNASYIKYPIYDLGPSGTIINEYLRQGNPWQLSAREAQILYALNRYQYQAELIQRLNNNEWIVAEDYTGTGMAWGSGAGVDLAFLEKVNQGLREPDLILWLDGQRFTSGIESGHKHENDDELINKVRQCHQSLADKYGWLKFEANQPIDDLNNQLWNEVAKLL
ncbi:MAG TPA: hypothetical protein PKN62_01360 [bacterium]|nr:hypothetical protein [bacterium]